MMQENHHPLPITKYIIVFKENHNVKQKFLKGGFGKGNNFGFVTIQFCFIFAEYKIKKAIGKYVFMNKINSCVLNISG